MSINRSIFCAAQLASFVLMMVVLPSIVVRADDKITFDDNVQPLFRQRCGTCHNPDKKSGGLDLTTYTSAMQGGSSGVVLEPGDASSSYLFKVVNHDEEPSMPPDSPPIPEEERLVIRKWIDSGILENKGSKAAASKKKKFDIAMDASPTQRPAVQPLPARLPLEPVLRTKSLNACASIATSPWSPLAAVCGQKQVLLYRTDSLQPAGVLPFPEGKPQVLKFSRNGSLLLAGGGRGGAAGKVVVWNVQSGRRLMEIGNELDAVLAADISADHRFIALGGPQKVVRIYSTETGELLHELKKHTDWIYSLEFSPDGVLLASTDRNGGVFVWEAATGRDYLALTGHTAAVTGVSWRGDSNLLATGSEDGSIRLWELENGGQVKTWNAHGGGVASIEFTRDGRIVSIGRDKIPKIWGQDGAQQKAVEACADLGLAISYCDETDVMLVGDWTGEIRAWKGADGTRIGGISTNPGTLAERIAAAAVVLTERTAQIEPANVAAAAAGVQMTAMQTQVDEITKGKVTTDTAMAEYQKQVDAMTAAMVELTKVHAQAVEVLAKLEQGVPAIQEELKKATEALAAAPDEPKKKAVDDISATLKAYQLQIENQKVEVAKVTTAIAEINLKIAAVTVQRDQSKTTGEQMAAKLKEMEPGLEAIKKQSAEMTAKAVAIKAQADASAAEHARWQSEVTFVASLNALLDVLKTREGALGEVETQIAAAQGKTATDEQARRIHADAHGAMQKEVDTLTTGIASADAEYKALQTQITTRTEELVKQQGAIDQLTKAVTALSEAVKNAKAAVDLAAGDAELAAAHVMLTNTVQTKTVAMKSMQDTLAAMTNEKAAWEKAGLEKVALMDKNKVSIAAATPKMQELKVLIDAAAKVVEESNKVVQQIQAQSVEKQKEVDAANIEIAKLQGIAG